MIQAEKLLIFAPHIDDAEFGAGGLIYRRTQEGHETDVVVLSNADYARGDTLVRAADRAAEMEAAMVHLGAKAYVRKGFRENHALNADYPALCDMIAHRLRTDDPDIAMVCLPSFNQDHRVLYDAFITATRPVGAMKKHSLWAYEYPGNAWGPQPPQHGAYVRLTRSMLDSKMGALHEHKTQFQDREGHVTPSGAEALAKLRGSECGSEYAEKFYLLRSVL